MNDELRNEVLRRKYGGQSGRDIARDLHLSRKTVAKVLAEHRTAAGQRHDGPAQAAQGPGQLGRCLRDRVLRDYLGAVSRHDRGPAVGRGSCPRLHGRLHRLSSAGEAIASSRAIGRRWNDLRRGLGSKPRWTGRRTRSTSARKAAARCNSSATCWVIPAASTSTSPLRRTWRRRSASTCGPSSTLGARPRPASTIT